MPLIRTRSKKWTKIWASSKSSWKTWSKTTISTTRTPCSRWKLKRKKLLKAKLNLNKVSKRLKSKQRGPSLTISRYSSSRRRILKISSKLRNLKENRSKQTLINKLNWSKGRIKGNRTYLASKSYLSIWVEMIFKLSFNLKNPIENWLKNSWGDKFDISRINLSKTLYI